MKKIVACILPFLIIWSCQTEDVFSSYNSSVVVEGWLIDIDTFQYVQLSESQSFDDQSTAEYLSTATVKVISNTGESYVFKHDSDGVYISESEFAGVNGRRYYLQITLTDGSVIESNREVMKDAPEIDSIAYDSYERSTDNNPDIEETVYYPIAYSSDTPGESNYYRYRLYRNDTLFSDTEYMVLLSDQFFDGNEFGNDFTDFEYFPGDSAIVELMEISETAYDYLTELKSQTTTLGTVSSVTPSNLPSNLQYKSAEKEVLGFWGVASVKRSGIKIPE